MAKAQDIREHMEVLGSDGEHVGTVDCMRGEDRVVLTKNDPTSGGQHHIIPLAWVERVDSHVHLNRSTRDAMKQWQSAA